MPLPLHQVFLSLWFGDDRLIQSGCLWPWVTGSPRGARWPGGDISSQHPPELGLLSAQPTARRESPLSRQENAVGSLGFGMATQRCLQFEEQGKNFGWVFLGEILLQLKKLPAQL